MTCGLGACHPLSRWEERIGAAIASPRRDRPVRGHSERTMSLSSFSPDADGSGACVWQNKLADRVTRIRHFEFLGEKVPS